MSLFGILAQTTGTVCEVEESTLKECECPRCLFLFYGPADTTKGTALVRWSIGRVCQKRAMSCYVPSTNPERPVYRATRQVMVASSRAKILGECSTIHARLRFSIFFIFYWRLGRSHTNSTPLATISPQWLSELRRLWPRVPWRVACELVS